MTRVYVKSLNEHVTVTRWMKNTIGQEALEVVTDDGAVFGIIGDDCIPSIAPERTATTIPLVDLAREIIENLYPCDMEPIE